MTDRLGADTLGIVLVSGDYARAHAAFLLAAGAAALDRRVILFATGAGCRALCTEWSTLPGADQDAVLQPRGVAGFAELREAALALGAQLIACESGLRGHDISPETLLPGVRRDGMASFLAETRGGQLLSL